VILSGNKCLVAARELRCEGMRDSFHVRSYHIQAVKRRILTAVEQDNFQDRSYGAMSQAFCKYINRADWVPSHIRGSAPTLSPSFLLAQAIFEPNLFPYKYSNILKPSHSSYLSAYEMEQTECSETSAYKIQTPGNYPEQIIQYFRHLAFYFFIYLRFTITHATLQY
jgi:hypothetical protein